MISLFCLGLREITDEIDGGRIGYPVRKWFIDHTPVWIFKPIIACCTCMASFWGTIIYWLVTVHYADSLMVELTKWETYALWIFSCVACSYINTIFWVLRNKMIGLIRND